MSASTPAAPRPGPPLEQRLLDLRQQEHDDLRAVTADLRPLHVVLESVDLRQVAPLSARVQAQFEALAVVEQRVAGVPDRLRLARQAADALRERAAGVAAAHRELAPTLDAAALAERRDRAAPTARPTSGPGR